MSRDYILNVGDILVRNGFTNINMKEHVYVNDTCTIKIIIDNENMKNSCYSITNNEDETMYSTNLNIYWLVGVLIYYNHIKKFIK